MPDFFRKIRKDSTAFVREHVTPRVRKRFSAIHNPTDTDSSDFLQRHAPKQVSSTQPSADMQPDAATTQDPGSKKSSSTQPSAGAKRSGEKAESHTPTHEENSSRGKASEYKPAAAHMKRIRDAREARKMREARAEQLRASRSAGRYGKSRASLPHRRATNPHTREATAFQPKPASSFPSATKAPSLQRSVEARKAATKRASSAPQSRSPKTDTQSDTQSSAPVQTRNESKDTSTSQTRAPQANARPAAPQERRKENSPAATSPAQLTGPSPTQPTKPTTTAPSTKTTPAQSAKPSPTQPTKPTTTAPSTKTTPAPSAKPSPAQPTKPTPARSRAISTSPRPVSQRRHIPGLDGVRGIAVIAVLLYHFWPNLVPGGFMGVDVFFVLSGYLITFLLVREYRKTGRISLKQFWLRRVRRILPAALIVIAVCTALVSLFRGDIAVKIGYHAFTSALFVSNWGQIAESGSYFSDADLNIFTHYWSLSIEEQFYLFWPLLVLAILAIGTRKRTERDQLSLLLYVTMAIGIASFAAMLVLYNPQDDPTRVYFGTDTHAFGLAVGAAIAFMLSRGSSFLTPTSAPASSSTGASARLKLNVEVAAWAGFVALILMFLTVQDTSSFTYRGGLLIASLLTGWLVALSVRGRGILVRVLSHPGLAWFGDRSFSLYLWHWPLFLMFKQLYTQTMDMHGNFATKVGVPVSALIATLACTYATYHYVENPFRKQGYRKTVTTLKGPRLAATTATASLICVGMVVAILTAPAQTNVEKQLQALAAQQEQQKQRVGAANQSQATGAAADPMASPIKSHQLPKGKAITAIGDSVMLASYNALTKRYPGIFVDADVSRHYSGGEPVLENLKAQKKLRNTVVLGFGTNGQAFPGQLERMLDVIGPDRTVIVVAPYGPVPGISDAAQQVISFAKTRPNVFPAMWCQLAADNPEALYSDRVHPKPERANLYVRAITDALKIAASGKQEPPLTCPVAS
ncbi:acyltransferase family protein [Corynebacterium auriscanis]|uniref:acyltransferase family protein n=1 Tax=Corynebacterium auriscanis TaxID=99807 RepID=UPI003CED6ECA